MIRFFKVAMGLALLCSVGISEQYCSSKQVSDELHILKTKLKLAAFYAKESFAKDNLKLGQGWKGNVFNTGPKCDEVFHTFEYYLNHKLGASPNRCLGVVGIFDSGRLPYEAAAHIFMGIAYRDLERPGQTGPLIGFIDPWRYGDVTIRPLRECKNRVEEMYFIQ